MVGVGDGSNSNGHRGFGDLVGGWPPHWLS